MGRRAWELMGPKAEGVLAACWAGASFTPTSVCTPTGTRAGGNRAGPPAAPEGLAVPVPPMEDS